MSDYDRLTDMQQGQLDEHEKALSDPQREGSETVTSKEAREIAQRFIDHFFGNQSELPRVSIPANPKSDDDLRLMQFIDNGDAKLTAAREALEKANYELAGLLPNPHFPDWMPALGSSNKSDAECLQKAWDAIRETLTQLNDHE